MEFLHKKRAQNLLSIYKSEVLNTSIENEIVLDLFQKSQREGLVQKKVAIKTKNGIHYAIRWVDPSSGLSKEVSHPKYSKEGSIGEHEDEKVQNIIDSENLSSNDKVKKLVGLGIYDKKDLTSLTGHKYPSDIPAMVRKESDIDIKEFSINTTLPLEKDPNNPVSLDTPEGQLKTISKITEELGSKKGFIEQQKRKEQVQKELNLTVDDKWESYEDDLNMLLDGELGLRAVMGYGTGGVGKTFTLESKILPSRKMIEFDPELDMESGGEEYDYVKIGGKIGSRETQRKMFEHKNKILIFDDCDSMWNDDGLINVLKNALDTSGKGKCQWAQTLPETDKGKGDTVPASFTFSGRMIFITNLTKNELVEKGAAAIAESRCASTDLSMNLDQTLDRLTKISPHIKLLDDQRNEITDVTEEDKKIAFEAFGSMAQHGRIDQINTRVLTQMIGKARFARKTKNIVDRDELVTYVKKQMAKQLGF